MEHGTPIGAGYFYMSVHAHNPAGIHFQEFPHNSTKNRGRTGISERKTRMKVKHRAVLGHVIHGRDMGREQQKSLEKQIPWDQAGEENSKDLI